jgi:putative protease
MTNINVVNKMSNHNFDTPDKIPLIMSPINSYDGGVRVVDAGADEVYCAVQIPKIKDFVLYRGPSSELSSYDDLERLVKYAHQNGAKVDLVINQPYMVSRIEKDIRQHIKNCFDQGVDSLIIGDFGVLSIVKDLKIDIPLIASTYLVSMNSKAINFLENQGFSRAVLERHLTLDEVKNIIESTDMGIEILMHGGGCSNINASCYLYHHKFPELINAQCESNTSIPCALPFEIQDINDPDDIRANVNIMDAFEYCSICKLPQIIDTKVEAIKIEGRTGSIWYQESTTKVYRELLDLISSGNMEEYKKRIDELRKGVFFLPVPSDFYRLEDIWCWQERCYYSPLSHAPYKKRLTWQTWTKQHFSWVQR